MTGKKNASALIRVDGSHEIGLGHVYRMTTLAAALRGDGYEVAFLTRTDAVANRLLRETGLAVYDFPPELRAAALEQAVVEREPDLIVHDVLRTSDAELREIRGVSPAWIVNLDDVGAGLRAADAVVNSIAFTWGAYAPEDVGTRLYEGPRYMILQPAVERYAREERTIADRARRLLLAFGGTDTHQVTERALAAVNRVAAALRVTVNLGPGAVETPGLRRAVDSSPHRVELVRAAPDLLGECHAADLVLCAGGVMLFELAAIGVPAVAIATEAHEVSVADYWAGVGSALAQGREADLDEAALAEAVTRLIDDRRRRELMARCGKRTMDGRGLARVMGIIREVAS